MLVYTEMQYIIRKKHMICFMSFSDGANIDSHNIILKVTVGVLYKICTKRKRTDIW